MANQSVVRTSELDNRPPLYMAIRDHLFSRIINGAWTFDEPITSESKLAKQYGVALGTMRRAIEELVREGVLQRRHGSGTYLRRSDFSGSLHRFLRFRSSHSTIAAQETRVLKVQLDTAPPYACEALGLRKGSRAIYIDRHRYHDGALLVAEEIWALHSRFKRLLSMPLEEVGPMLYRTYETKCGQPVARAVESLRVRAADAKTAKILDVEIGTPVLSIERTAYDLADQPIEWRHSLAKADHFEYRIEIR